MPNKLEHIFKTMDLNKENGLYEFGDELPNYPLRIKVSLESISYDAIYDVNGKPLIIFKEFETLEKIETKIYDFHKDVWNFGETPILFIVLPEEIRIYNGFVFDKKKNDAWKNLSGKKSELDEFSFINLISGKFWKENESKFNKRTRVQDYLLDNLTRCRELLNNQGLPYDIINNLLCRLIFSRYLLDRNILKKDFFKNNYGCSFEKMIKSKNKLYSYFDFMKEAFNGDMFKINDREFQLVKNNHLSILSRLFKGDNLGTGQAVLFDVYDFSIIPIELVSSIYENFIHRESSNSNKAYYTPLFLVDYILKNTLEDKLKNCDFSCKILDPACGSGIFLVESLRKIIEKKRLNLERELSKEELIETVKNCIFGVDLDKDAINITIFSIYLTLLDYLKPDELESFRFPELKNENLFIANFFDTHHEFNKKIKDVDIILGNPPWGSKFDGIHVDYCRERNIPLPNKQIALSFMARAKDFANKNTHIALIITSKVLYNLKAKEFRKYFLTNFFINQVFEFSSVRRVAFNNATGPGSIIFYNPATDKNTEENLIKYISLKNNRFFKLFKSIVIEKRDIKYILQDFFLKYDWIWKVILYGNVDDFLLIKRLKEDFDTFEKSISNKGSIIHGVGIQTTQSTTPIDASSLIGKKYLETKNLERYHIDYEKCLEWNIYNVHRLRNTELFKPPHILMKVSLNNEDYMPIASFSDEELLFKHSIQAIKGEEKDKNYLKSMLGLLNSKFFAYYMFITNSTIGIERPQVRSDELASFPTVINPTIAEKVDILQNLYEKSYKKYDSNLENQLKNLENEIDNFIFNSYELTDSERDLVDYTINVSIPIRKGKNEPFDPPNNANLQEYSNIFTNHFEKLLNDEYLDVEVYDTDYFITMNFKTTSEKPNKIKFIKDNEFEQITKMFGNSALSKLTKDLYVLRDIKGFEENSFYVIKPKEYKNWHKAIARSDLAEFMNAMIKSGLKNSVEGK